MSIQISLHYNDIKQDQETVFKNLTDPYTPNRLFSRILYSTEKEVLDPKDVKKQGYDYVYRITKSTPYKKIVVSISEADEPNKSRYELEWKLEEIGFGWTRVTTSFSHIKLLQKGSIKPISSHVVIPATLITAFTTVIIKIQEASAQTATVATTAKSTSVFTSSKGGVFAWKIMGIIAILVVGGSLGSIYANSHNAITEMEYIIRYANEQYENEKFEISFNNFSKVEKVFENTKFSPDHLEYAENLHMQSLIGMGNSLQSQSDFGQIRSFSEKSEEYYLYAHVLYEGKYNTDDAWIGRGINAIYEAPEKALDYCSSLFNSVNSHMCQGEAYSYMYVIGEEPLEKAEEQFEMALNMAGSEKQKLNVKKDIAQIYKYYKLPIL